MAKRNNNKSSNASAANVRRLVNQALAQKASGGGRDYPRPGVSSSTNAFSASALGPIAQGGGPGSITVSNQEFVSDLNTSDVSITSYDINPVSGTLFTWLSRVAVGYELFRIKSLDVIYTPMCGSTTQGVVVMAFDYDASDIAPTGKQALSAYQGAARGNVWAPLRVKLKPMPGWFYNGQASGASNPVGTDVKFYVPARMHIGMFNGGAYGTAVTAGELSVKYTIEFAKPDFATLPPNASSHLTFSGGTLANVVGGITSSGNVPVDITSDGPGSYVMTFRAAGQFLIEQVAQIISPSALANPWTSPLQTDPGKVATAIPAIDNVVNAWVNSSSAYGAIHMYAVGVIAGTAIKFATVGGPTLAALIRLRIASYNKANG